MRCFAVIGPEERHLESDLKSLGLFAHVVTHANEGRRSKSIPSEQRRRILELLAGVRNRNPTAGETFRARAGWSAGC